MKYIKDGRWGIEPKDEDLKNQWAVMRIGFSNIRFSCWKISDKNTSREKIQPKCLLT